jgi:hypothetical protein
MSQLALDLQIAILDYINYRPRIYTFTEVQISHKYSKPWIYLYDFESRFNQGNPSTLISLIELQKL